MGRTPARYVVEVTDIAQADLDSLAEYWNAHAPWHTEPLLKRLEAAALRLETLPARGRVVPELRDVRRDIRELIVRPYRIVYRLSDRRVSILAFLDSRRDLRDVLVERSIRAPDT